MLNRRTAAALILVCAAPTARARAQGTAQLLVEETAGIRRTSFPLEARLEVPAGRLGAPDRLRLVDGGDDVPVQGSAYSTWPDGSVRELGVAFNASLDPHEARALELHYGDQLPEPDPVARGLAVSRLPDGLQVGRLRLSSTAPVIRSVAYRAELIVPGRNGVSVLDDRGTWHRTDDVTWEPVEVRESGPLRVTLIYHGRLTLAGGHAADVAVDLRLPNSKSWLEISARVTDPQGVVRAVAIETPIHLGEHPWTWDFATANGTYGAFRNEAGAAVLTLDMESGEWRARAGNAGDERPYEEGTREPGSTKTWIHLIGSSEAVAFALDAGDGGELTARLRGNGQTSFELERHQPGGTLSLTLFEHYVSTPVPIGAATSPASILSPPRVSVR